MKQKKVTSLLKDEKGRTLINLVEEPEVKSNSVINPAQSISLPDEIKVPNGRNVEIEFLISRAIDKSVPVETMEKLLSMRRELKAEKAKQEFDSAMAVFQAECPTIEKTKAGGKTKGGFVAYHYAPIESIVEQVKELLKKYGFSYSTTMELLADGVKVSLKVTHSGGHSETSQMTIPFGVKTEIMSQSQVVASACTFAKRYAFCNAFGILTGDEDLDGVENSAIKQPTPIIVAKPNLTAISHSTCEENKTPPTSASTHLTNEELTGKRVMNLRMKLTECGKTTSEQRATFLGMPTKDFVDLATQEQYTKLMEYLRKVQYGQVKVIETEKDGQGSFVKSILAGF